MIQLLGQFDCKVDAKGRVRVPSGLAKQLSEATSNAFVLHRALQSHLTLYPKNVWDSVCKQVDKLNDFDQKALIFKRWWYAGVQLTSMDGADRILIPKKWAEHAGIDNEVTMVARKDRVEVWSTQAFEAQMEKAGGDMMAFAESLLGDSKEN